MPLKHKNFGAYFKAICQDFACGNINHGVLAEGWRARTVRDEAKQHVLNTGHTVLFRTTEEEEYYYPQEE